jgi:tRNA pseudouridine55 synthase
MTTPKTKPTLRKINGILLLDKPAGLTSNAALQKVKRLFHAKKAGHTGSLDPIATGMLPICFGEATKFSQFLLNADKTYEVAAKLGVTTTTGDSEGDVVVEKVVPELLENDIEKILEDFRGPIQQIPPMFSAIKYQGQPLYKLARQGIEVKREPRDVTIHELNLLQHQNDVMQFRVSCSKGTYIRTLITDIGERLGYGAHVIALRRLYVAGFKASDMLSLKTIEELSEHDLMSLDKTILPVETALQHLPAVTIGINAAFYLKKGSPVMLTKTPSSGLIRLMLNDQELIGIGEVLDNGMVAPRRLVSNK